MTDTVSPLQFQSLKSACVGRLEGQILSGEWQIGARLPSERDLAASLNISRPVLHEALVDLAAKGLVSIQPRRGVFISDFRTSGSCALLASLLTYHGGRLDPAFTQSLLDMRLLLEAETAALAAIHRTPEQVDNFDRLLAQEQELMNSDPQSQTELDFSFHLQIAIASGNLVYPLIINSFKSVYTHLTGLFFQHYSHTPVLAEVSNLHRQLIMNIRLQEPSAASQTMIRLLQHGEKYLKDIQPADITHPVKNAAGYGSNWLGESPA